METVDREWCRENAPFLGVSALDMEECFLGEDAEEAARIINWAKGEERRLRRKYGRKEAWKVWNPRRMIRRWALKHGKGAFGQSTGDGS